MPNATTPDCCSLEAQRATSLAASGPNCRAASKIQRGAQAAQTERFRGLANGGEIRLHILHAAQHHAGGNGDLRVDDVLPDEFFGQVVA